MDQLKICLKNVKTGSQLHEEIIWPVIHATEKAWRVKTSGGPIWVPKFKLQYNGRIGSFPSRDALVQLMLDCTSASSDTQHRVWKSRKGPTAKSHKFKVAVIRTNVCDINSGTAFEQIVVRRTLTLPISQVRKDEDGKWMAPRWLFKDRLGKSEKLARATWQGMAAVNQEIDEAAARLDARIALEKAGQQAATERAKQEKQAEQQAQQAKQAEWDCRSAAIDADAPFALKFCKARFNLLEMREELARCGHPRMMDCWPNSWHSECRHDVIAFEGIVAVAIAHSKWGAWRAKQGL